MSRKPIGGRLRRTKRLRKKYWKHVRVVDTGQIFIHFFEHLEPGYLYV